MLQNFQQFVTQQAVKNQIALLNPKIILSSELNIPRESVIHYLDTKSEKSFPDRKLVYLANIPKNKKVPIHVVRDLAVKDEVTMVKNKTLDKDIREWFKANLANFRAQDLFTTPNTDVQTNAVINYNLLRDLYRYAPTITSSLSHKKNLWTTYWDGVHKAAAVDRNQHHFVSIGIPNTIPSAMYLQNLSKLNPSVFARVMASEDLFNIYQLHRYLDTKTREQSTMRNLTDEDTQQVMVELKFHDYSCVFKLSDLVSMSSESDLPGKRKILPHQLQKLLVIILFSIQKRVYSLENMEKQAEGNVDPEVSEPMLPETDDETDDEIQEQPQSQQPSPLTIQTPQFYGLKNQPSLPASQNVSSLAKIDGGTKFSTADLDKFINSSTVEINESDVPVLTEIEEETPVTGKATEDVQVPLQPNYDEAYRESKLADRATLSKLDEFLTQAKKSESMSTVELRNLRKLAEVRKELKSPYKPNQLYDIDSDLKSEDTTIDVQKLTIKTDIPFVKPELKKELLFNFDRQYLEKGLRKDILAQVKGLEKSDLLIRDYTVETKPSSLGAYELHKLTLKPYKGKESSIYFRIPVINSEGEFVASGIRYRMKRSRQDCTIRKIAPNKVALTSNYSKLFISRTERVAYDPYRYLSNYIKESYLNEEGVIKKITPGSSYDNTSNDPNVFSNLSKDLQGFSTDLYTFQFAKKNFTDTVKPEVLESIAKLQLKYPRLTYCGYRNKDKHILVVDETDTIYDFTEQMSVIGTIDEMIGVDSTKMPKPFSNIKVLGDDIPLGVVMAYYLGLENLIGVTNTKFTTLPSNKQYKAQKNELVIKFEDYKLILTLDTEEKRLLFHGFLFFKQYTPTIPLQSLNSHEVYLDLLQFRGYNLMHLKEMESLRNLFLDAITKDVLASMSEPTDYLPLLLRANRLLTDFQHPDINDPAYSRIRGFDRVPGLMYRALSESVRESKIRGNGREKIELDPYKVWNYITQDSTVKITEDANPISDVKEVEAGTFAGIDGVSKNATPEKLRRYHKNDRGLVSEATVDSSDVGLNFYLSPYAKLKNLRGLVDTTDKTAAEHPETIFSTSALLTPFVENDDPKRVKVVYE